MSVDDRAKSPGRRCRRRRRRHRLLFAHFGQFLFKVGRETLIITFDRNQQISIMIRNRFGNSLTQFSILHFHLQTNTTEMLRDI